MTIPRIRFHFCVHRQYSYGYLVRITRSSDTGERYWLLSRKSGLWIRVTLQQIKEQDIPSHCLFPVDELPESIQNGPT